MPDVPASREVQEEDFWRKGGGFRWMWPVFFRVTSTAKSLRVGLNRYPHNIIGAWASFRGRGVTVNWKGTAPRSRYKNQRGLIRQGHSDA